MSDAAKRKLYTGVIADIPVSDKPEDDRVVDQTIREAQTVKVEDGVEYDPESLKAQRWIEARFDRPTTLIDENVDRTYWKGLAGFMKGIIRRTSIARLRDCREVARQFALNLHKHDVLLTPMKSQLELNDRLTMALCSNVRSNAEFMDAKERIGMTLDFWRECNYRYFNERFMGRKVG